MKPPDQITPGCFCLPDTPCNSRGSSTKLSSVPLWPSLPTRPESLLAVVDLKQVANDTEAIWLILGFFTLGWESALPCCSGALGMGECLLYKCCYGGFIFCSILSLGGSRDWWSERREGCPGWKRRQRATGITRKYPGSKQHFEPNLYLL